MATFIKVIVVVALCMAGSAQANVYFSWGSGGGFITGDTVGATFGETPNSILGAGSGDSVLFQLIWSPVDATPTASTTGGSDLLAPGEVLLDSFVLTETGTTGSRFGFMSLQTIDDGGANPSGGYVYARVFENDTPTEDDWYYVGETMAAADLDTSLVPAPLPQEYELVRDPSEFMIGSTRIESIDESAYSFQVVPEPGTIALLTLGIATLGGAARKRRKAAVVEA